MRFYNKLHDFCYAADGLFERKYKFNARVKNLYIPQNLS